MRFLKEIKHDLRYIKTEQAIRKTFHELLQEKDVSKITVKELTERAEINKTTFYATMRLYRIWLIP